MHPACHPDGLPFQAMIEPRLGPHLHSAATAQSPLTLTPVCRQPHIASHLKIVMAFSYRHWHLPQTASTTNNSAYNTSPLQPQSASFIARLSRHKLCSIHPSPNCPGRSPQSSSTAHLLQQLVIVSIAQPGPAGSAPPVHHGLPYLAGNLCGPAGPAPAAAVRAAVSAALAQPACQQQLLPGKPPAEATQPAEQHPGQLTPTGRKQQVNAQTAKFRPGRSHCSAFVHALAMVAAL